MALFAVLMLALGFATTTSAQDTNWPDVSFAEARVVLDADPSDTNRFDGLAGVFAWAILRMRRTQTILEMKRRLWSFKQGVAMSERALDSA